MTLWKAAAAGIAAGVAATAATSLYQAFVAPAFGADTAGKDPANVRAADTAAELVDGHTVAAARRKAAGSAVHYATGTALGLGYALAARRMPMVSAGFGTAFGLGVALVLDDLIVPAFGWGDWPVDTPASIHAYGLSTHLVFGTVLEGGRRAVLAALA